MSKTAQIEKNKHLNKKHQKQINNSKKYIPPYKLKQNKTSQNSQQEKQQNSKVLQKKQWDIMCKSIKGIINKASITNIEFIVIELFNQNLIKGRGIFVNTLIKNQEIQPKHTNIYACIANVVNSKLPQIGQILIIRLILKFRIYYQKNDRLGCKAVVKFLAHLINQKMLSEMFGIQMLIFLLENFTEDSLELACFFLVQIGQILAELSPEGIEAVYESLKDILEQHELSLKCQFLIEKAFDDRKTNFAQYPSILQELKLVNDDEIIVHNFDLDEDGLEMQEEIDQFNYDKNYEQNEEKWQSFKHNILQQEDIEILKHKINFNEQEQKEEIQEQSLVPKDMTNEDLQNFRVQVYMRIMNSVSYEEAAHKLLQLHLQSGLVKELCELTIDSCLEQKSYTDFYGQLCTQLSEVNQEMKKAFFVIFADRYFQIFDYDVQKIRKLAYLFAFMFYKEAIDWEAFSCIELSEEETTSSSRIFIKFLFQKLTELMGIEELHERLRCPEMQDYTKGIFYCENHEKLKFVVDFFTFCGLNGLILDLKSNLKQIEVQRHKKIKKER